MAKKELSVFSELDRLLDRPFFESGFHFPALRQLSWPKAAAWTPEIDVFERNHSLVTRVDLPGMKKGDVKVEVTDGHLSISGERKSEVEETKDNVYRCERSTGSFQRVVPLPDGVTLEDVKASFADGVLEVVMPLPVKAASKTRQVEISEPVTAPKAAA